LLVDVVFAVALGVVVGAEVEEVAVGIGSGVEEVAVGIGSGVEEVEVGIGAEAVVATLSSKSSASDPRAN
jgi:hypothetical protein